MENFFAVLNQVLIFLIIMIVGFVSVKTKYLPVSFLPAISGLFASIVVPFIIFVYTVNGATRDDVIGHSHLIAANACAYAALILLMRITPKLLRIKGNRASLFTFGTSFGNVGFVGIPLLLAVFGARVMIIITIFSVVDLVLFSSYGYSLSYPTDNKQKFSLKTLRNIIKPPFLAIVLAIVFIMLGIRLPVVLNTAFTSITNIGLALPLIYMGGVLTTLKAKDLSKYYDLYAAIALKMIAVPICIFLTYRAVGFSHDIAFTSAILFGLPSPAILPMLASANGSDAEYATVMVLLTTLSSLFTLTLISYITAII